MPLPLLDPFEPKAPIFWTQGGSISGAQLLARADRLARRLPDKRAAIIYSESRDSFTVALIAAWLRGQTGVFPADRSERSYSALTRDDPSVYCLTEQELPFETREAVRLDAGTDQPDWTGAAPTLAGAHPAVKVLTSGSTGKPTVNDKTWAMLIAGGKAIPPMIRLDGYRRPSIVATVPSQHMYGFELAIMNVLQGGATAHVERPIFPADIARCLDEVEPPRILTTTPIHLRALVESKVSLPGVEQIVSATAPLSPNLAAAAERKFGAPVWEIYGFTEAGSVAGRRTTESQDWRLREDFEVLDQGGQQFLTWPAFQRRLPFPDIVEPLDRNRIRLHGRAQDTVNVAGKRASLSGLSALLQEIEGVEDGAFWLPSEDEGQGKVARPIAFVVAPQRPTEWIRQELLKRMDAAFVPRQVVRVDSLGRNATGKLPQEALRRLAAQHLDTCRPGPITTELSFDSQHPCLEGHFPDNPVVPAAAILAELTAWAEAALGRRIVGVKSARFRAALLPEVNWTAALGDAPDREVAVTCRRDDEVVLSAKFILERG